MEQAERTNMRKNIIIPALFLLGCNNPFAGYLEDYNNLDLTYENEAEAVNANADYPENLTAYESNGYARWAEEARVASNSGKPFKLDTFHGDERHFERENIPLEKVGKINNEKLFSEILKCYPSESLFNSELKIQTTASPIRSNDPDYDNYYAKVVWEMPLYSSSETTQRMHRETQRRTTTAEILSGFSEAIARRNQQLRLVSLYRNLEKRSQIRVSQGLADATEQIGYLEKTSQAHTALLKAESDILKYRLQLVSLCADSKAPKLNRLLKKISAYKKDMKHDDVTPILPTEPTQADEFSGEIAE